MFLNKETGRFYTAHEGQKVNSVAFDVSGQRLLSAADDGVRIWGLDTWPPTLLQSFLKSQGIMAWTTFAPDGSRVASVGRNQPLRILRSRDGGEEQVLVGHESTIYRAVFSLDGGQVASISTDATGRL